MSKLTRFYKAQQTSSSCLKVCIKQRPFCDSVPTTKCYFLIKPTQSIESRRLQKAAFTVSAIGNVALFMKHVLSSKGALYIFTHKSNPSQ